MTQTERNRQLDAARQQIRDGLGHPIGDHLDHAREWIGDRAFLQLSSEFSAGEVIICCGIRSVAALLGEVAPRKDQDPRDAELTAAVNAAHAALQDIDD